jgi:UDP-2-acetamido-3-amino-2,3-dideoxy-glucuronate N-acetyltransferase
MRRRASLVVGLELFLGCRYITGAGNGRALPIDRQRIEDEVFIGHGVMFTNDLFPAATNEDGKLKTAADWTCVPTRVCKGTWIGSNATILAGVTIGERALVGADAVVVEDVEAGTIVVGVPARVLRRVAEAAQ